MYNQFLDRVTGNKEKVYTDKQLRPFVFKATKKQFLPLTAGQVI